MGKTNGRMPESRENTNESSFGISPVESQGKLTQAVHDMDNQEYIVEHAHEWQLVTEWETIKGYYAKFICHCGAVKRVKQFEVEE